ncbi:MAG TPA: mechanosensitive ion channel [Oligoflexia bacterium]|nr:mechanosensitive ion channel [Oligoflexia bacterium]HMR24064.1 mechanosensitive ion channel [Oligoflexia bacterium]
MNAFVNSVFESDYIEKFIAIWNFPLVTFSGRSISVSNIVIAVFVLITGLIFSKLISKILERHFFKKFRLDIATSATVRVISNYIFIVLFSLLALHFANIPLTIFTFLGGAIALGVGFGSQSIINNFISGLIVLFERPVKVGDFIEIDSTLGLVEHIGSRSTRLLKPDNTHAIMPNSWLLEKKVLNWNYRDRKVRTSVLVGVAYGSNVENVFKQLNFACEQNSQILKKPVPTVLFESFGDNALLFEVIFWVEVDNLLQRRQIESSLRFEINQLFTKHKITIAFPQRDVHLDASKPLPIQMIQISEQTKP